MSPPRLGGNRLLPYLLAGPILAFETLFILYPIVQEIIQSFTKTELGGAAPTWVGVENYQRMLSSESFWGVMLTTFVYGVLVIAGSVLVGLGVALLLNRRFRGRTLARALLMMPWALPDVPTVLIFNWMFNPEFGVMNVFARLVPGIDHNLGWFLDPALALIAVLVVTVWKVFPFYALVILAALQTVPGELYDAAKVDGAGAYPSFRNVTLPWITPTLLVLTLLAFIFSFRQFTLIHLLTGGGPSSATETLVIRIFNTAFRFFDLSYGATLGVAGLVATVVGAFLFIAVQRRYPSLSI